MLRVGEVTPAVIDATYVVLRERGSMKGGPLKPGTLSRIHVVLRSAFSQAQRWGWVWHNPAERAHRIVVPPTEMQPPTPAELQQLLNHIEQFDRPFHALVLLAATTGARRAQLLGLRPVRDPASPGGLDATVTVGDRLARSAATVRRAAPGVAALVSSSLAYRRVGVRSGSADRRLGALF